jgi:hypothetical protein
MTLSNGQPESKRPENISYTNLNFLSFVLVSKEWNHTTP